MSVASKFIARFEINRIDPEYLGIGLQGRPFDSLENARRSNLTLQYPHLPAGLLGKRARNAAPDLSEKPAGQVGVSFLTSAIFFDSALYSDGCSLQESVTCRENPNTPSLMRSVSPILIADSKPSTMAAKRK